MPGEWFYAGLRAATTMIRQNKHSGVALILVLWIITLLTMIAVSFLHTMRTEVNVVGNSLARIKAETLADAGLQRAIYELFKPQNTEGRWIADGSSREWRYRDIAVNITMQDEAGRIDINTVNPQLLRGLLLSQGLIEDDVLKMVDVIADWRDADSQRRPRGAEVADYLEAGLNYGPANAPFQALEELGLVMGMTPDLYQRLAPLITVFSRQTGINEQIATRDVLRALPNVSDDQIDAYLAVRDLARAGRLPVPTFPQNLFRSQSSENTPTRIRTEAAFADGNSFTREVVVRRYSDSRRSYAFLSWKEGRELVTKSIELARINAADAKIVENPAITGNTSAGANNPSAKSGLPNQAP